MNEARAITIATALSALAACRTAELAPPPAPTGTTVVVPSAASSAVLPMAATAIATAGTAPSTPPPVGLADPAACKAASDCEWGEINKEILATSDCMCLFGCPHLALSKQTVERRRAQHTKLCKPGRDGNGRPCPVDDCALPGPLACVAGKCAGQRP